MNCCLGEARRVSENHGEFAQNSVKLCLLLQIKCDRLCDVGGIAWFSNVYLEPSTMTTLNTSILGAFLSCDRCLGLPELFYS